MKYAVDYQGKKIYVELDEPPKKGVCSACGKKVGREIKITQLHHFRYAYSKKQIEKNPKLALENTAELDFHHHKLGNALMNLLSVTLDNVGEIVKVARLMPPDMKLKMDKLCEKWQHYREKEGVTS